MLLKAIAKLKYNDKVVGLLCESNSIKAIVAKSNLHLHSYTNIKVTKDLKIVGNIPEVSEEDLDRYNIVKLHHASHTGLRGRLNCSSSRPNCDFGLGFYTGDSIVQAKSIVVSDTSPYLYTFYAYIGDLSFYTFANDVIWALFVCVCRGYISLDEYPKLRPIVDRISSNDIIRGLIADDRMYYVYTNFINGLITDVTLADALQYVKLGSQYVFKTQKACDYLTCVDSCILQSDELKQLKKNRSRVIGKLPNEIDELFKKHRRDRDGKFIDEVLEVFR